MATTQLPHARCIAGVPGFRQLQGLRGSEVRHCHKRSFLNNSKPDSHAAKPPAPTKRQQLHNNNSNTIVQESELPKFANDLKEAIGAMRLAEGMVDLAAAAAPQPTLRNLCRNACGGRDTDAERQDLWQRTALHRKRHVNLVLIQTPKDNTSYFDAMR